MTVEFLANRGMGSQTAISFSARHLSPLHCDLRSWGHLSGRREFASGAAF